jgi:hypothetical protein
MFVKGIRQECEAVLRRIMRKNNGYSRPSVSILTGTGVKDTMEHTGEHTGNKSAENSALLLFLRLSV